MDQTFDQKRVEENYRESNVADNNVNRSEITQEEVNTRIQQA